ncbi:MAG: MogA/MoaB family molybdenum cofactor biosynthesis protein [Anaerolineaceae bacterium]|nr:MogA/MoaB family molybdenum cofactor biosynthesis protein [Anaerolineaceae bacterium]
MIRTGILTISDRSSKGKRTDLSGPALQKIIAEQGWQVVKMNVIADEINEITATLINWCDKEMVQLILTTGGTGFAPRDITPEATLQVIQKNAPGIAEALRAESLKITPHAMLSRGAAGIRGKSLIVNLPGSPKAAAEYLQFLLPVIPHAIELIEESPAAEKGHAIQ